jgi:pyruvate dehydrogenase E2 component (dihydrolipoamide acetyltransferase)/2-oxoglutarate dehydrogenase E2 component (dihydrolipoamide succinyltransferase)
MPQLGMAQDAGLIVAWHKKPGDEVASDDVLMEVETDKATMEVPAGVSGFLAEIRAEAGSEVPVGNVIAVIADSADEAAQSTTAPAVADEPAEPAGPAHSNEPIEQDAGSAQAAPAPVAANAPMSSERILASPKAKFVAHERGIDLQWLVDQGVPQPYHVADLDKIAEPAAASVEPGTLPAAAARFSTLNAFADRAAFEELMRMAGLENLNPSLVFGAFAASALRHVAGDRAQPIVVECRTVPGGATIVSNPDLGGLSQIGADEHINPATIMIHDLTGTRLSGYQPAEGADLQVSISGNGADSFALALAFSEGRLTLDDAAAFFDGFVNRIENPIQHIV